MDNLNARIHDFRNNPIRQNALMQILQDANLQEALAICELQRAIPPIPLDADSLVSVRAAALSRGAAGVLDTLYRLAQPIPPNAPEETHEGSYGVDLSKIPDSTTDQP